MSAAGRDAFVVVATPLMVVGPSAAMLPATNDAPAILKEVARFLYAVIVTAPPSAVLGRVCVSVGKVKVKFDPAVTDCGAATLTVMS